MIGLFAVRKRTNRCFPAMLKSGRRPCHTHPCRCGAYHRTLATRNSRRRANPKLNVLLICVDHLKPTLGCYGDAFARTATIDAHAARTVRFDAAYCNHAVCSPARNALLTSLRPCHVQSVMWMCCCSAIQSSVKPEHSKFNFDPALEEVPEHGAHILLMRNSRHQPAILAQGARL